VLEQTLSLIFLTSIPLAIGGVILGTQLMSTIFGSSYATGGLAFKILMITLIFDFPATVIGSAIFAYNHQKNLIISSSIASVGNVVFDLLLIPRFGITGSAVATLIAQVFANWYLWRTMNKLNHFEVLPYLKRIIISGAIMAVATIALSALHINVIINIVISTIIYFATLKMLNEPLLHEIAGILKRNPVRPEEIPAS
jgi:O-antigen/teichoic acid export membrane protein